jgi:hypothetical protein
LHRQVYHDDGFLAVARQFIIIIIIIMGHCGSQSVHDQLMAAPV